MANRVYIRKIDSHCVDKEISLITEVHNKVFLLEEEFDIVGKRTGVQGKVTMGGKPGDRRFNGDMKAVIRAELGDRPLTDGDILIIRSTGKKLYSVEMITDDDPEYVVFDEMCGDDRHTLMVASKNSNSNGVEVRQLIKYGVPGTGKSYGITEKIKEIYDDYDETGDSEFVFRTTLHPEYSYYDFVGSTYPIVKDDKITYDFRPGIFTSALKKALDFEKTGERVFLVLEEMSRANVAAVFGDLFQLLDRDDNGVSEYKIRNDLIATYIRDNGGVDLANNNIYLPANLYIYGTVNTSDQNVFVMDNAFKRRFEFEYVSTDPVVDKDNKPLNEFEFVLDSSRYKWSDFYRRINSYVTGIMGLREDKQIGPFFLKFKSSSDDSETEEYNFNQIKNKLLQYLWEDVHKCAMAEHPLFREDVTTFGDAYSKIDSHENIFCQDFCDLFIKKSEVMTENPESDGESDESDESDNN